MALCRALALTYISHAADGMCDDRPGSSSTYAPMYWIAPVNQSPPHPMVVAVRTSAGFYQVSSEMERYPIAIAGAAIASARSMGLHASPALRPET
jgi:hypothetical protein